MANPTTISLITSIAMAILLFSSSLHAAVVQGVKNGSEVEEEEEEHGVPVRSVVYRPVPAARVEEEGYEPFELCMGCRCCSSANASSCVDTRCCYAIDCNIPGKPFGVCALTPHSCDCGAAAAANNNCTGGQ